jgi:hypothetical protein
MLSDWLLLLIEGAVLLMLIVKELGRSASRNLVSLMLFLGLLVIVTGQQWYILNMFEGYREVYVFENRITREGFHLASLWVTATVVVVACCHTFASPAPLRLPRPLARGWPDTIDSWAFAAALAAFGFVLLCIAHRGIRSQLTELGSNTGGIALALSVVGFAKYPYLHRVAFSRKPMRRELLLLIGACLLMVINSRGFALTVILQLFVICAYKGRGGASGFIARCAIVGFMIVVVYGSLRDFVHWRYASGAVALNEVYEIGPMREFFVDRHFDFVWLFYEHSVGVFSGFAGILSYDLSHGVQHDWGLSTLVLLPHLTPYGVRTGVLRGLDEWLSAAYPYRGSVVPGGFEASFAHFGFAGIVVYSLMLGLAPTVVEMRFLRPDRDQLKWGLLAPYIFTFVMCDVSMAAFFVIVELASLSIFRLVLASTAYKMASNLRPSLMKEPRVAGLPMVEL